MRLPLLLAALALGGPAGATGWDFTQPEVVTAPAGDRVFPHLESAGRRSLAAGTDHTAVVWEDNRSGTPQAYIALRPIAGGGFGAPLPLSAGGEAFEPAVAAVGGGRFVTAWEEDGRVRFRMVAEGAAGPVTTVAAPSRQVTLAARDGRAVAAWSERRDGIRRVVVAALEVTADAVRPAGARAVDPTSGRGDQLYPTVVIAAGRPLVAWEDRRHGHTRLYYSRADADGAFPAPTRLNELPPSQSNRFGRGTGVTRVAVRARGGHLAAVWMDKRDFKGGYDIYAAAGDAAAGRLGANELVQDLFGSNTPQWHPTVAVAADGTVIAVWDDPRDGNPDLWFSVRRNGEWSDDFTFAGGSGPGAQRHPALALGPDGRLHVAWVDRGGDRPRILYAVGRPE